MLCANNMHAYGKDGVYLGPTSRPPDHTWGQCLARACPTGRVSGAYRLTVCVCRANGSKLQATSSDLHRGASGAQGWIPYRGVSTILAQCLAMPSVGG